MGFYVNPATETKEAFLEREGTAVRTPAALPTDGTALVCLVENFSFSAASVVYSDRELEAFTERGDLRPKSWFAVPVEKLYPVVDGLESVFSRVNA